MTIKLGKIQVEEEHVIAELVDQLGVANVIQALAEHVWDRAEIDDRPKTERDPHFILSNKLGTLDRLALQVDDVEKECKKRKEAKNG